METTHNTQDKINLTPDGKAYRRKPVRFSISTSGDYLGGGMLKPDWVDDEVVESNLASVVIGALVCIIIVFAFLFFCGCAQAEGISKSKFVDAIIGEAEGEPYIGKLAVACAIRNRGTLNGVYGVNAPRVKARKYSSAIFVQAVKAYEESAKPEACEFIDGADHWEGSAFNKPTWAYNMRETFRTKGQVFYVKR
jgi:hypothetical protein